MAFFTAAAATNLLGPVSKTIISTYPYESGSVDASGYSSLTFSFDYDSKELEGEGDSFTYGWRAGGGDHDIDTVVGLVGTTEAEVGSLSYPLPEEALVVDLEVYINVVSDRADEFDEVKLTNISLSGDLAPVLETGLLGFVLELDGGDADLADLQITLVSDGDGEYDFVEDGDSNESHVVVAGETYTLSVSGVPGYTVDSIECDGGIQNGAEITIAKGEVVTCRIVSTFIINEEIDPIVFGCMDENASNFNPNATESLNDTCTYDDESDVDEHKDKDKKDKDKNNGKDDSKDKNKDKNSDKDKNKNKGKGGDNDKNKGDDRDRDKNKHRDSDNEEEDLSLCEDGPDWLDNPYWAYPGKKKDGSDITDPNRTDPSVVLGEPDWTNGGITGFYSMGFGGFLVVDFYNHVLDVDGVDLTIYEATNGNSYPQERAEIWVSQIGGDWKYAGMADNTASDRVTQIDFSDTGLPWIQFVKLVDVSDSSLHSDDADGFDLDAIGATMAVCKVSDEDCPDDDNEDEDSDPETYIIGGYKYVLDGENKEAKEGWTIYAFNHDDDTELEDVTDENGYYSFEVEAGDWEINEEILADWEQVSVWQNGEVLQGEGEVSCEFTTFGESYGYFCDFYNEYIGSTDDDTDDEDVNDDEENVSEEDDVSNDSESTRESNPSSGTRIRRLSPTPFVLGASTSQCEMFLHDYTKFGYANSEYEVKMLQYFLNGQGYFVPVTGFFGPLTHQAVKDFQQFHQEDVLKPWFDAGIVPHQNPTGYMFMLTRWKINNIVCPGSEPLPELIP